MAHYFLLTEEDLENWEADAEEFAIDEGGESWKFQVFYLPLSVPCHVVNDGMKIRGSLCQYYQRCSYCIGHCGVRPLCKFDQKSPVSFIIGSLPRPARPSTEVLFLSLVFHDYRHHSYVFSSHSLFQLRPCTEVLFLSLFHEYRETLSPVLLTMAREQMTPIEDPNDIAKLLQVRPEPTSVTARHFW